MAIETETARRRLDIFDIVHQHIDRSIDTEIDWGINRLVWFDCGWYGK